MTDDPRNEADLPDDPEAPTQDDSPPPDDAGDAGDGDANGGTPRAVAGPRSWRHLRRSEDDRMIAGVAGGLAEFFSVSTVPIRIGFVVLTLFGGIGAYLYLLGWLVLPTASQPSIISAAFSGSARGRNNRTRWRSIAAVVLIILALLFFARLSDDLFRGFGGFRGFDRISWDAPFFALVLLLVGAALVIWPGRRRNGTRRAAPTLSDAHATGSATQLPDESGAAPIGRPDHAERTRTRRGPSLIGTLCIAALPVFFGTLAILHGSGALEVEVAMTFAGALAIAGIGLAASAFTRPATGLYFMGAVFAGLLLLTAGSRSSWSASVGDRVGTLDESSVTADASVTQIRHGFGRLTVNLDDLPSRSLPHEVDIELAAGELRVLIPDNLAATIVADVGAGSVSYYSWSDAVPVEIVPDERSRDRSDEPRYFIHRGRTRLSHDAGLAVHRLIEQPAASEPEAAVELDIDVSVGTVEIVKIAAAPTEGLDQ